MSEFTDRARLVVRAGDGGAGVASFQKQRGRPRGKPTGGSGGNGGSVFLEADARIASLYQLDRQPHRRAGDGSHGEGENRHGRQGDDLVVPVPLGTMVYDEEGTLLADLVEPGQRVLVAAGGRGGRGNSAFVGRSHRAPSFAEQGEYGTEAVLLLEMKLLADAALVGYPNAGKSTLISAVSAARPKIADYPFTTLEPHLGVVTLDDREFVLADIPGLIAGAAQGKGLGHEFLRHTERARALILLLDPVAEASPGEQLEVLLAELAAHSPELAARPRVIAVNKIDLPKTGDQVAELERAGLEVYPVSAATRVGLPSLLYAVAEAIDQAERLAPDRLGYVLHRPATESFVIRREGDAWRVEGQAATRAVALADLTVPEAADFVAARLTRLGLDAALYRAGTRPGDEVRIGELAFEYHPASDEAPDVSS